MAAFGGVSRPTRSSQNGAGIESGFQVRFAGWLVGKDKGKHQGWNAEIHCGKWRPKMQRITEKCQDSYFSKARNLQVVIKVTSGFVRWTYWCFCCIDRFRLKEELHFHQTMNFTKPDEEDGVGGGFVCFIHVMLCSFVRLQNCRMLIKWLVNCMLIKRWRGVRWNTHQAAGQRVGSSMNPSPNFLSSELHSIFLLEDTVTIEAKV